MTEYKIYKIVSSQTDKIYIGSTKQKLGNRLSGHKTSYKAWLKDNNHYYLTSFEILKFNDYAIELIESCIYIDNFERDTKEGHYIKLNKLICVNKRIETRTPKEYLQDNQETIKHYRDYHREEMKQYRQNNKEKISERKSKQHICVIC